MSACATSPPQLGASVRGAEVERDRLLRPVEQREEPGVPGAGAVGTRAALDLDHPRAAGGEQRSGERPCPQCGQVDDQRRLVSPARGPEASGAERCGKGIRRAVGGNRQAEQPAPSDERVPLPPGHRAGQFRPVRHRLLDHCRRKIPVVAPRQIERNVAVGGGEQAAAAVGRDRAASSQAQEPPPFTQELGAAGGNSAAPLHRRSSSDRAVGRGGQCDRGNQPRTLGAPGQRH